MPTDPSMRMVIANARRAFSVAVGRALLSALAPRGCAACDAPIREGLAFCAVCAISVEKPLDLPSGTLAVSAYGGAMAIAVNRLKFNGRGDLATPLGHLLASAALPHALCPDPEQKGVSTRAPAPRRASPVCVVPVPLHPSRLAARGYNQSALLAGIVAKRLSAKLLARALERTRDTPHQTSLSRSARAANVYRAFAVCRPDNLRGHRIVLVDDVRTTGATLGACARALYEAGAVDVRYAVLAIAAPFAATSPAVS